MSLLIGSVVILLALWIVANDPTMLMFRRRMRLEMNLRVPSKDIEREDLIAIFPQAPDEMPGRHGRRQSGGRMKSPFRSKPSFQKRKAR